MKTYSGELKSPILEEEKQLVLLLLIQIYLLSLNKAFTVISCVLIHGCHRCRDASNTPLPFYAGMALWRSSGGNRLADEAMYGFNRNVDRFGTTNCKRFKRLTMKRPTLLILPSLVQPLPL